MTKKHFIALANHIKRHNDYAPGKFTAANISSLADFCGSQSPRFNRDRWIGYIKGENDSNGRKAKP